MAEHSILAHVETNAECAGQLLDVMDAGKVPGSSQPWVFMQEVSVNLRLVFIQPKTNLHMSFALGKVSIELGNPTGVISVQELVQLVEHAEVGARRTADDEERLITVHNVPCPFPVSCCVEVESVR